MIYGDVKGLINELNKEKINEIKKLRLYFKNKLLKLKKENNDLFLKEKQQLILRLKSNFEKKKSQMMTAYKLKELEIKEKLKEDFINNLIQDVFKKINEEKLKKSNKYFEIIKTLTKKGIEELGGKSFKIRLGNGLKWVENKLKKDFKSYKISFLKEGNFENGVIIYNYSMNKFVNNDLNNRLIDLKDEIYSLVSEMIKWVN